MYDSIIFVIDNGKLDDLFLDSSKSEHLDYENINGDSFYSLPPKYYDRFVDWADSNGFQDGEDWYEVDTKGNQIQENKMKLTPKEKKLVKEYAKKLVGKRLNERSLKGAVNFERAKRFRLAQKQDKIKWFDNLTYREKQDYYTELKGRKGNLVWITDENKVAIYNKKHN